MTCNTIGAELLTTTETSENSSGSSRVNVLPTTSALQIGHVTYNLHAGCAITCFNFL